MKNVLIITLAISLMFSCKKGKADFTVTGTITNTSLSSGLNGATVSLYEIPAGSVSSELIGTTTTNLSGVYSFSFPRNQSESYIITCTKSNHFSIEESINFSDLSIKEDNVINYSTTAKSWVKLRFLNNTPSGADVLNFTRTAGKNDCDACCVSTETSLVNILDTSIYCINDGNNVYSYSYIHQGTTNFGEKSVVTASYDTTELLLTY
tara:strand:- start:635 stop:1258 length:624 start_codon:yes stop_codon:yes gene_type:complete